MRNFQNRDKKTPSPLTRSIFIQFTWNLKQSFLVRISNASRERFAIFNFFAELFDIKLRRYKTINNAFNRKSSLDALAILAKNLCLKFQVNRIKIDRVRGEGVFADVSKKTPQPSHGKKKIGKKTKIDIKPEIMSLIENPLLTHYIFWLRTCL